MINIYGTLHDVEFDPIVAYAAEICDANYDGGKKQDVINRELKTAIENAGQVKEKPTLRVTVSPAAFLVRGGNGSAIANFTITCTPTAGKVNFYIPGAEKPTQLHDVSTHSISLPLVATSSTSFVFTTKAYSNWEDDDETGAYDTKYVTVNAVRPVMYGSIEKDYSDITNATLVEDTTAKTTPSGEYSLVVLKNNSHIVFKVPSNMSINLQNGVRTNGSVGFPIVMEEAGIVGDYKYYRSKSTYDAGTYSIKIV